MRVIGVGVVVVEAELDFELWVVDVVARLSML